MIGTQDADKAQRCKGRRPVEATKYHPSRIEIRTWPLRKIYLQARMPPDIVVSFSWFSLSRMRFPRAKGIQYPLKYEYLRSLDPRGMYYINNQL